MGLAKAATMAYYIYPELLPVWKLQFARRSLGSSEPKKPQNQPEMPWWGAATKKSALIH